MTDKPVRVVTPQGIPWITRFKDRRAAWGRILALHRLPNTPVNRGVFRRKGWRIMDQSKEAA